MRKVEKNPQRKSWQAFWKSRRTHIFAQNTSKDKQISVHIPPDLHITIHAGETVPLTALLLVTQIQESTDIRTLYEAGCIDFVNKRAFDQYEKERALAEKERQAAIEQEAREERERSEAQMAANGQFLKDCEAGKQLEDAMYRAKLLVPVITFLNGGSTVEFVKTIRPMLFMASLDGETLSKAMRDLFPSHAKEMYLAAVHKRGIKT